MIKEMKDFIRVTYPFYLIRNLWKFFAEKRRLREWQRAGRPIPPPNIVKIVTIKEYAMKLSINNFIETGTYVGDTIYGIKDTFNRIYSIELDNNLFMFAKSRFAKYSHIEILHGDSGDLLPNILIKITQPCLFWLDAHYSGGITKKADLETPMVKEISSILSHQVKNHCILIDDARCFNGRNDYPTIEALEEYTLGVRPEGTFEVKDDIIRIKFLSRVNIIFQLSVFII
jgi:hypothetical protein